MRAGILKEADVVSALGADSPQFHPSDRNRFRLKRFSRFMLLVDKVLAEKGRCRIIDIGGTVSYWQAMGWDGRDPRVTVTLVNLEAEPACAGFECLSGDARALPFADKSYDLVHSNSVIEHVGRWRDMVAMASEVRRLADHYFVQTPYYWFPIEPHFRFPFFHMLPEPWRLTLVRMRSWGFHPRAHTIDEAMDILENAWLLDLRRYRSLFPDADIEFERALLLPKSMIATR